MPRLSSEQRGLAAVEVVFSLPIILLCLGVTVYVGTMMKARLELLSVVQQVARNCSMGQTDESAPICVANEQADVEARLERCNNLVLSGIVTALGVQAYDNIADGLGQQGTLADRNEVSLDLLEVTASCDVQVGYPLPFSEFGLLAFDLTETAAMPLRLERNELP